MKATITQIVILVLIFGSLGTSVAQTGGADGYTDSECAECHADMADDHAVSLHRDIPCLQCHPEAVAEDHETLSAVDCRQCHAPHDEKVTHDAHARVACRACHQNDGLAVVDAQSREVIFKALLPPGREVLPHQRIARRDDSHCRSCHFKGNKLGASSMTLPPKSILCMPCHVATLFIGDRITVFSLLIFTLGMGGLAVVWFSGSHAKQSGHRIHSGLSPIVVSFVDDVLFIKRLYRLSPMRWTLHALFYYPILMRFAFGALVLVLSLVFPEMDLTASLLDKNYPLRALLFEVTGLMIIVGVAGALFRSHDLRETIIHLPAPGRGMTMLLGTITLVGFFLEGLRIAMTGWPAGTNYAFIGYGISLLLRGMTNLSDIYGYLWYFHAILVGLFTALIPFTRMIHIITAPVVLMADASSRINPNR